MLSDNDILLTDKRAFALPDYRTAPYTDNRRPPAAPDCFCHMYTLHAHTAQTDDPSSPLHARRLQYSGISLDHPPLSGLSIISGNSAPLQLYLKAPFPTERSEVEVAGSDNAPTSGRRRESSIHPFINTLQSSCCTLAGADGRHCPAAQSGRWCPGASDRASTSQLLA